MGRRVLAELAIDGVLIGATAWLVFAWPFGQPSFMSPEPDPATPARQELRSPEIDGAAGESQRALARDRQSGAQQAALGNTAEAPGSSAEAEGDLFMVTATRLNMRAGPDAGSAAIGSYPRGALVEQLNTRGNWVLVRVVDDQSMGWMYADYLAAAAEN